MAMYQFDQKRSIAIALRSSDVSYMRINPDFLSSPAKKTSHSTFLKSTPSERKR